MSLVFKITNGLTIAEYVSRNMRPIAEAGYTPGDDLAALADEQWQDRLMDPSDLTDEWPPADPPTFPISQKDGT